MYVLQEKYGSCPDQHPCLGGIAGIIRCLQSARNSRLMLFEPLLHARSPL